MFHQSPWALALALRVEAPHLNMAHEMLIMVGVCNASM